jgi:hypothetical protein
MLMQAAEEDAPVMLAEIAMRRALNVGGTPTEPRRKRNLVGSDAAAPMTTRKLPLHPGQPRTAVERVFLERVALSSTWRASGILPPVDRIALPEP